LAAKGAAIAAVDPIVAKARTAEPDVLYWLGFDIATGFFGDPALGGEGRTSTGPGSLGIRDALSAPGQRGFNASVALHLRVTAAASSPGLSICDAARRARARNSPAAPWANYKTVFSGGDGIVYAITYEGKLLWFKQIGFAQGAKSWLGPKEIKAKGTENWADYKHVFSAGARTFGTPTLPRIALDRVVIYAIDAEGKLWWYGHRFYGTGENFLNDRSLVGHGWGDFTSVFALLPDAADVVR
jgi:hypothetical protein